MTRHPVIFILMGLVLINFSQQQNVVAQQAPKAGAKAPGAPPAVDCSTRPKEANDRYRCFVEAQDKASKAAEKIPAEKKKLLQARNQIEEDRKKILLQKEQRSKQEIKDALEKSKKRSVSNKGKKYKSEYGKVIQPRE